MTIYGSWETEAPLTPDEFDEDKAILSRLLQAVPDEVTIRDMEIWVHGREYRWRRLEVYP